MRYKNLDFPHLKHLPLLPTIPSHAYSHHPDYDKIMAFYYRIQQSDDDDSMSTAGPAAQVQVDRESLEIRTDRIQTAMEQNSPSRTSQPALYEALSSHLDSIQDTINEMREEMRTFQAQCAQTRTIIEQRQHAREPRSEPLWLYANSETGRHEARRGSLDSQPSSRTMSPSPPEDMLASFPSPPGRALESLNSFPRTLGGNFPPKTPARQDHEEDQRRTPSSTTAVEDEEFPSPSPAALPPPPPYTAAWYPLAPLLSASELRPNAARVYSHMPPLRSYHHSTASSSSNSRLHQASPAQPHLSSRRESHDTLRRHLFDQARERLPRWRCDALEKHLSEWEDEVVDDKEFLIGINEILEYEPELMEPMERYLAADVEGRRG